MKRIELLINDKLYIEYMKRNVDEMKDPLAFHHDFQHHLDVARIAYIIILEHNDLNFFIKDENLSSKLAAKEVIYAAGLLHDVGKWKEYSERIDHASFGAKLARDILARSFFNAKEIDIISRAVFEHSNISVDMSFLGERIHRADNLARAYVQQDPRSQSPKIKEISVTSFEY